MFQVEKDVPAQERGLEDVGHKRTYLLGCLIIGSCNVHKLPHSRLLDARKGRHTGSWGWTSNRDRTECYKAAGPA